MTPSAHKPATLPDLLLKYQQALIRTTHLNTVTVCEKSRRIGMTWGIASDAVLTAAAAKAAKGMDVFYIGYNLDMAREFIDTCGMWAKNFHNITVDIQEFLFDNGDADPAKHIKAFRIVFASGFEICALSSKPRSLRGRQGYVIIDEAAFHDNLPELLKSAMALLMWGGRVLVISTHDGADNPFNKLCEDIRAGRLDYALVRVDLDDALKDGLYKRICLTTGQEWSTKAEIEWREDLVAKYGDAADEELFCIPRRSGGAFLSGILVESRMLETPVIRYRAPDELVFKGAYERERTIEDWCEENLKPLLAALDENLMSFFGEDFGRTGDLTVLWPVQLQKNLKRYTPFVVELANVPFNQQEQIVWFILDRLPRFCGSAFDARGNGSQLAETTMQRYGAGRVHRVMISREWYRDTMPKYKRALEDGDFTLPKDADILSDHRAAIVVDGVPVIPDTRGKSKDGKQKRHGDSLIAAAMAHYASLQPYAEYAYEGMPRSSRRAGSAPDDDDDVDQEDIVKRRQFGNVTGAW